ncbi:hypothetical protein [Microbacterium aurantiacum]|uniref:Uncharacterized protein n=1 Tax=Microbacterium aurantiacum TaxID=162393 RepID=A0A0M8MPJ6_9MICO|nr:hypothetical protein [Microbacterium chocolatum]ANG85489.1 hypothetical protein A8L33_08905 [Microbacterium chocolatum]KOS11230.1 hypothetical protein XI38_05000 [Microbacterium chocolatum]
MAATHRALEADLGGIPITRVTQFVIGWMRAAFHQSVAIATLTKRGLATTAAPNRRSFAEIAVRLQWLHSTKQEDRAGALDAMLDHERELTEKNQEHLRDMGFDSDLDLSAYQEMVFNSADGALKNEARQFLAAAKRNESLSVGLYAAWREETQYTHATGAMAAAYAPANGRAPFPSVMDPDLSSHIYAMFLIVTLTYNLLTEEGIDEGAAKVIVNEFVGVR